MKQLFWFAIIPLILVTLSINSATSSSNSSSALDQKECDCSNLKVLQIELRNAQKLQQAFRNKIPELRQMETEGRQSSAELKRWAESDARRGLEEVPGHSGAAQVDYKPWGDHLNYQDDERVTAKYSNEELCRRSDESAAALEEAKKKSACAGIAQAIQVHEDWHLNFCRRIGYRPYWLGMSGADRAQEEVEAYGAQIAVLRAEIAKVLEKAELHVIVEVNTRMQMPPNPLYTAINVSNKADIPMNPPTSVGDDSFRFEGTGSQETNGSIEGNCRFTSGLPSSLPARVTVETNLVDAKVNYNVEGTSQSMTMECQVGGQTGRGMSFPVPIKSNNKGDFTLSFENGATKEFDQGSGQAAQIMASGGAKLTGKGIVRLVFCNTNK